MQRGMTLQPCLWASASFLPCSLAFALQHSHDAPLQTEVLLISNDLLGTNGRHIQPMSVCIWLLMSLGVTKRRYLIL